VRFTPTFVDGVVLVDIDAHVDGRGFFARTWCAEEFAAAGLASTVTQSSISWNERRHTLRGLHWQASPHGEHKVVRCVRGAIWDVAVDLRPDSPTHLAHVAVQLDEDNRRALVIPPGCAHGFLTLADRTEVEYLMDAAHVPHAARGARFDDPAFAIEWPAAPAVIADRDATYPDFVLERAGTGA
jgi:dTDP-4-dehydrorhamnose 3,5-epimerase